VIFSFGTNNSMRDWDELNTQEQLELRQAYGHYLDTLPPTCSMDEKNERFRRWLAEQGVNYQPR
jgi:hypothetical protein